MEINRAWAMPNKNTFRIAPIRGLLKRHLLEFAGGVILDPFANESRYGTITNDLNPDYDTDYHMDALDFLKMFENGSVDCVLYDPPYSARQVSESYKGVGREVTGEDTSSKWRSAHLDEIRRILRVGGKVLCFGWNSSGLGKTRGFEMIECLLVAYGGMHYDTICTVEVKSG